MRNMISLISTLTQIIAIAVIITPNSVLNIYAATNAYENNKYAHITDNKNTIDNLNMSLFFILLTPFLLI